MHLFMIYLTSSNSRLHLALSFIRSHTAQTFPNDLFYLTEKASPQIYYLRPAKTAKDPSTMWAALWRPLQENRQDTTPTEISGRLPEISMGPGSDLPNQI